MYRAVLLVIVAAVSLAAPCCGEPRNTGVQAPSDSHVGRELPQGSEPVNLDPKDFSVEIDNRYWPMVPGTRWTYHETDQEGAELQVVVTVTDQTKKIANGVTARVVRDTVTEGGKLVEDTFDWYAQDKQGNIWYLGEDTAEFENGEIATKSGSFEAGVDGAQPGIIMPGDPQDGMQYRQEYYKGEAEDNGEILSTDEMAEAPYGQFDNALLTKDTITIEPDVLEYKLYAPDVGPVLVVGVSGGPGSREELIALGNAPEEWTRKAGTAPLGKDLSWKAPERSRARSCKLIAMLPPG